jgi:hypothetical protein
MTTFVEITKEAFMAVVGDETKVAGESSGTNGATIDWYKANGVTLRVVTNFYSKAITQYYIQDINA